MQTRELREYCDRRGWNVVGEYVDVGISGANEKRPELERLMVDGHNVASMSSKSGSLIAWHVSFRIF